MRILILEDERVAARRLERLVRESLGAVVGTITHAESLESALEYLETESLDLLLLDLNLSGEDGFTVLRQLIERPFQTIVVSANTDRAIEAFELGVLDFVPKPIERERLSRALGRFTSKLNRLRGTSSLVIKNQGMRRVIPVGEIRYIGGAGDYAELHCLDGTVHLYSRSLEGLSKLLPEQFVRIHKSYILDKGRIKEVKVHGGGRYDALLDNGEELPISRTRYRELFGEANG